MPEYMHAYFFRGVEGLNAGNEVRGCLNANSVSTALFYLLPTNVIKQCLRATGDATFTTRTSYLRVYTVCICIRKIHTNNWRTCPFVFLSLPINFDTKLVFYVFIYALYLLPSVIWLFATLGELMRWKVQCLSFFSWVFSGWELFVINQKQMLILYLVTKK